MPEDNPATPPTPGDTERILPPSAVAPGAAVTNPAAVAPDNRPSISMLYVQGVTEEKLTRLVDQSFQYNQKSLGADARRVFVSSFDEFVEAVRGFSSIGRLVIMMHSTTNAIEVGNEWQTLDVALDGLAAAGDLPEVTDVIELEGCVIGQVPSFLIAFARLFRAPRLTAFTYWHYVGQVDLYAQPGIDPNDQAAYDEYVSKLTGMVWEYAVYLPPGAPSASTIAADTAPLTVGPKGQTYHLMIEWFEENIVFGHDAPPLTVRDSMDTPSPDSREHDYRTRDSASPAKIGTDQEAKAFEAAYADFPIKSFYLVEIQPIY